MNKCVECEHDQGLSTDTYDQPYLEGSGLDIIIRNATHYSCKACGAGYLSVHSIDELHALLVRRVIMMPYRLDGVELRFLRKMLGWSARDMAKYFQVPHTTISKWEHNDQNPRIPTELLLRMQAASEFKLDIELADLPDISDAPIIPQPRIVAEHRIKWYITTEAKQG